VILTCRTGFFGEAEVVDAKDRGHLELAVGVHHVVRDLLQNVL
jgi:hypothetical protein